MFTLRVAVLILLSIATVAMLVALIWNDPQQRAREPLNESELTKLNEEILEQGNVLVGAIMRYKADTGLWPRDLDELPAQDIQKSVIAKWSLSWWPNGEWRIRFKSFINDSLIKFIYSSQTGGKWMRDYGDAEIPIDTKEWPKLRSEKVIGNKAIIAQLNIRASRYPDELVHAKEIVNLLLQGNNIPSAIEYLDSLSEIRPEHWWPVMAKVYAHYKCGNKQLGQREVMAWLRKKPCFRKYILAGCTLGTTGDSDSACSLLEIASRYHFEQYAPDIDSSSGLRDMSGEGYAYVAAMTAIQCNRFDVLERICLTWQPCADSNGGDRSYLIYLALCKTKNGRHTEAVRLLQEARGVVAKKFFRCDALKNEEYVQAILSGNRQFTFQDSMPPYRFTLFPEYE